VADTDDRLTEKRDKIGCRRKKTEAALADPREEVGASLGPIGERR